MTERIKAEIERTYRTLDDKIRELNMKLPRLKAQIREFFELSTAVKGVYLQIDDFYHLNRADQPLVMDYIHRLCKDLPLYFKVATLKHATTLLREIVTVSRLAPKSVMTTNRSTSTSRSATSGGRGSGSQNFTSSQGSLG